MKLKKWPSFSMIELLVSLAIYLVAMTAVVSMIGLSGSVLQTYSRVYASEASSMIAVQTLESFVRASLSMTEDNGEILIKTPNGNVARVSSDDGTMLIRESGRDGLLKEKKLVIRDAERIAYGISGSDGRKALLVTFFFKKGSREKLILASYQKNSTGI